VAYRFFDNPRITEYGILAGHVAATAGRHAMQPSDGGDRHAGLHGLLDHGCATVRSKWGLLQR
jgi:hypothetical protein